MKNNYSLEENIKYICNSEYKFFLEKANVIGVGLGYKSKGAFRIPRKCINVFVTNKFPKNQLLNKDIIPKYYKSIETDVVLTEMPKFLSFNHRIRPVLGGYSIGSTKQGFEGTMGCVVTDGAYLHILSCCHIIAQRGAAVLGNPVVQPAMIFGGRLGLDDIAYLSKYIPMKPYTTSHPDENLVDCAMAEVHNRHLVDPRIALLGGIKGIASPSLGLNVQKVGENSELTTGRILSLRTTILVKYNSLQYLFKNQICTTSMTEDGDSGALLLDMNMNALGICMSGSITSDTFNPIKDVLSSLDVQIVFG